MQEGDNHHSTLRRDFGRFSAVGVLGFIINLLILDLLYRHLGLPIFLSQLVGSEIALFHNFVWHHKWTYRGHNSPKKLRRLIIEFHASSWVAILAMAAMVSIGTSGLHLNYFLSLVIASIIAALWNFGWTRFYIWRRHTQA